MHHRTPLPATPSRCRASRAGTSTTTSFSDFVLPDRANLLTSAMFFNLSTYLTNGIPVVTPDSALSSDIYSSGRFMWAPVISSPVAPNNADYYPILTFRPIFVTQNAPSGIDSVDMVLDLVDSWVKTLLNIDPGDDHGLLLDAAGTTLRALRFMTIEPTALPAVPPTTPGRSRTTSAPARRWSGWSADRGPPRGRPRSLPRPARAVVVPRGPRCARPATPAGPGQPGRHDHSSPTTGPRAVRRRTSPPGTCDEAGMAVLDRNWRCELGELDLVLRDGPTLVVCEVKTRRDHDRGSPARGGRRGQARPARPAGRPTGPSSTSAAPSTCGSTWSRCCARDRARPVVEHVRGLA